MYAVPSHCPAPLSSLSSRRKKTSVLSRCLVTISYVCERAHHAHVCFDEGTWNVWIRTCVSMKVHGMYGYVHVFR